jgi:cell fate regulator YaaT (PSP1 superfamily)
VAHLIEVAFRGNRKEFFRWDGELPPALKAAIVVEADRGEDLGHVHSTGELAEVRCKGCPHGCGTAPPARVALRIATAADQLLATELASDNETARQRAMERVKVNGLVMKLTDAEWQWDRKKLTFYFTSDKRVDFRTLVRELASMFRTRIELKQIGVRDEAKRLSGIGRCGREYCSSSWLPDLRPVNLAVAKDQKLSLNPSQISGACGRLMCCLRYEHEFYVQSRRRFPKEGKILRTRLGEEKVISCNIFHETVVLRTPEGDTRTIPLIELTEELAALGSALSAERLSDSEPAYAITEESAMSETQEFMVAREAMPMVDILLLPADEAVETPVDVAVSPVIATSPPSAPDAPSTPDGAVSEPAAGEGEMRRKRRRGRRGGRRLRGIEGRGLPGDAETESHDDSVDHDDDVRNDIDNETTTDSDHDDSDVAG